MAPVSSRHIISGQMLLNWFLSSFADNNQVKKVSNTLDHKTIGIQYCTYLLAAGVLRQIPDKDAPPEQVFKPNLMYYWAHMDVPAVQPITPGKLQTSLWPPDKDTFQEMKQEQTIYRSDENQHPSKNNNNEIQDILEAQSVISDLKKKLHKLEKQLEQYRLNNFETNQNLYKNLVSTQDRDIQSEVELVHQEVQTFDIYQELDNLTNKPVINATKQDAPLRTSINTDFKLELSRLNQNDEVNNKTEEYLSQVRSEKIENYCKLNKSRDINKQFLKEASTESSVEVGATEMTKVSQDNERKSDVTKSSGEFTSNFDSSSDASFLSTTNELITTNLRNADNEMSTDTMLNNVTDDHYSATQVLFCKNDNTNGATSKTTQSPSYESVNILESDDSKLSESDNRHASLQSRIEPQIISPDRESIAVKCEALLVCQQSPPQPPPLPGMPPLPPPMPGTIDYNVDLTPQSFSAIASEPESNLIINTTSEAVSTDPNPRKVNMALQISEKNDNEHNLAKVGFLVPPLTSDKAQPLPTGSSNAQSPSQPLVQEKAPPLPRQAPIPPPMPGLIPPPPPMSGMGPPPPPMPGMGPPPPPMPGMGPPPPPMPGMGPPPPPMPGMGPPPPPMPGMGPPPPPMPGMGPPPPPMPGMGLPVPPMPGMSPPPPPMPGMGPPPPPMPGMGPPPPPPVPGSVTSSPPVPGLGPPPPPMLGANQCIPPPPANLANSGPVPFPAPPVGGWNMQRATLRKTPVKPAAPMKPLYWTRILAAPLPPTVQGEAEASKLKPLWLEIEETNLDNIDEFTDLFSRQVVKAPVKKKVEVKTKIQPIKILDSKRSQNVGILAQSLHVEFSEIENAIYNFDTSVVSLEALQQIYELRATEEELALIKEHLKSKPDIPLDKPESFLHDLSGIPNFAERISCFMFQADFEDSVNTTMHKLDNLKHTCEFLMKSEPLKQLFAIILTLGNYMNGGNGQRGQADGFGLEILSKLKDVKSKQSHVTLLHFIVRTYVRARGGALAAGCALPVPEPGDVARAAALDFADVAAHLTALANHLKGCKEKMKKVIDSEDARSPENETGEGCKRLDVFRDKMTSFMNAAEEKLKTENENLIECRNKFIATVKFYQYTPKCGKVEDCEPKEFFSLWIPFCSDFKDIFKKEEQLAIKEKLKETKKLQEERRSLTQPKKEGGLKARLQKISSTRK